MSVQRQRTRRKDPLATPDSVRSILDYLHRRCPNVLPASEKQAMKMLESVRHYVINPDVDESKGRPRRWPRENVAKVAEKLKDILKRKTGGRISTSSFISTYLPILRYPTDISDALREGEINIREAAYLAQLTPERLRCAPREAKQMRTEILKAHLLTKGSQESLRRRTKTALGVSSQEESYRGKSGRQMADELIKKNPFDARHLFYEEIQQLVEAMRDIGPEDLKGKRLVEFLRQLDRLLSMLRQTKKKSKRESR